MDDFYLDSLSHEGSIDIRSLFTGTLLVHPDIKQRALVQEKLLSLLGELHVTEDISHAMDILVNEYVELVVISLIQQEVSPIHMIHAIQHYRPGLPILVIANNTCLQDALIALREGAWDYVIEESESISEALESSIQRMAEKKLGLIRDVSHQSERLAFWSAVQRAQDGLAIVNAHGKVSFANACFMDFIKILSPMHMREQGIDLFSCLKTYDLHVAEQFRESLKNYNSRDKVWRTEIKIVPRDDMPDSVTRYFQLDVSSIFVCQSDSIFTDSQRHVLWVTDTTEIREYEQFQREVISTTSHDLKGPLATISSAAEMILDIDNSSSENTKKLLRLIMSSAEKSQRHIEEFLSTKRIEAGFITVEPNWYSLSELIFEIITEYEPSAHAKHISISYTTDTTSAKLYADKIAFDRVLGNILSNAIKYIPEHANIVISAEERALETVIHITDTGDGISQDAIHSLFSKYSRLDEHSSISGTGLGLYIVKSIMDAHKGKVEVQSEKGKGTTFSLYFPHKI